MAESNIRSTGLAVEATSSWPSPAQDYYQGPLDLNRALIPRPASTFVMRVNGDAIANLAGTRSGDAVIVDRAIPASKDALIVAVIEDEHRIGRGLDPPPKSVRDSTESPSARK